MVRLKEDDLMPVNKATLNQIFDGNLGPIAVQEAKGAATRLGKQILQDGISAAFGSSTSQIDKFLTQINAKGIARTNLFEVKLNPPGQVNNADMGSALILRCESVAMPGLNLSTVEDVNLYGPTRDIVDGVTYADEISMTFLMDKTHEIRKYFQSWMELAYDPNSWNLNYYDDYASGTVDIYQLSDTHQPTYGVKLWGCYPKNFAPIQYSNATTNEMVKLTVNFTFRFWTDIGKYGNARPQDIPSFQFPNVQNVISNAVKDATEVKPFGGGVGTGTTSKGVTTGTEV